jgi:hypothetical protein
MQSSQQLYGAVKKVVGAIHTAMSLFVSLFLKKNHAMRECVLPI